MHLGLKMVIELLLSLEFKGCVTLKFVLSQECFVSFEVLKVEHDWNVRYFLCEIYLSILLRHPHSNSLRGKGLKASQVQAHLMGRN